MQGSESFMKLNVVFLDCTQGYGYAFSACNTKIEFMARGLTELGNICYIHNGLMGKAGILQPQYQYAQDIGHIIDYPRRGNIYLSPYRNYKLLLKDLIRWRQDNAKNIVVVEAPYLPYYYLEIKAARKASYKVVAISHEWLGAITFAEKSKKMREWMLHLYSYLFGYCVDAILPISEYIINKIKKFHKPFLKVPVEADFSRAPSSSSRKPYFLYCVMADYYRVINIVLDGFKDFCSHNTTYKLILVLSGSREAIERVSEYMKKIGLSGRVEIKSKLPYDELLSLYSSASGLVVALDPNNKQDEARFSQKIAEYLSSGTIIVSNQVGEVKHYFHNKINILMDEFSSSGFCNSFRWIAENPEEAASIGLAGYELGKKEFDYRVCANRLNTFLDTL